MAKAATSPTATDAIREAGLEQRQDGNIGPIIQAIEKRSAPDLKGLSREAREMWKQRDRLRLKDGILVRLFVNKRLRQSYVQTVVPTAKRERILKMMHDDATAGHLSDE